MNKVIQGTDTGNGETLIYDSMSGRFFYSDRETIRNQISELRAVTFTDFSSACDDIRLNDIYGVIGLSSIDAGEHIRYDWTELKVTFIKAHDPLSDAIPYYRMIIEGLKK